MKVEFTEKGHVYSIDGEIASISVTELLTKHGLSPYNGIKSPKMQESAEKGKEVHKDLENILNVANYEPTTEQGKQFAEWVKNNLDCGVGEQMLGFESNGLLIAGTADVMGIMKDGALLLADHKNTSQFHREYVSWQVSLLDYFARRLGDEKINGKLLKWKGASKFMCFHYDPKDGTMSPKELTKIADTEIERLLDCELNGEIYQRPNLVIDPELEQKYLIAEANFLSLEKMCKQFQQTRDELREQIQKLFEEQNIKSWESHDGKLLVTYIPTTEQTRTDSAKLKKNYPQVFAECQKITTTKAHIRVTTREDDDEL